MDSVGEFIHQVHELLVSSDSDSDASVFGDIQISFYDGTVNYNTVLLGVLEPVVFDALRDMHDLKDVIIIYPDKSLQSLKELHKPQDIPFDDDDVIEFEVQIKSTVSETNCSVCDRHFSSKKQVRRHYYYKHYNNDSSIKMSKGKVQKKTHKKDATGDGGNFDCSSCGKTFKRKQELDRHMGTVHSSEVLTRFQCHFCNSTFNRKDNLFRHVSKAHPTI